MTNLALYQLSEQYRQALETLGELELPPEAVNDTLDALQGEVQVKATNVACVCRNLEALTESIKFAEEQMAHRRKVIENRIDSIKAYIKKCMETAGITKIESPYFKLAIKNNPGAVVITDFASLPSEYKKTPPTPPPVADKKKIADAIKEGKEVAGAYLDKSTRLSIE